ncbi:MAG: GspH/FimT family pseudopilin [Acidiferrobacterales bacterium]
MSALPGHVGREPFLGAQRFVAERGFTLPEVLVTLTIIGIMAVSAVGFARILHSTQMTSQVNTLIADLSLARSEAIKRGYPVTLCQSNSGADCTGASDWHLGWILFADIDSDRSRDEDEALIRSQQALPEGTQVQFGGSGRNRNHYVTYWPEGSVTPNGTFTFCDSNGNTSARAIVLYWTGRARVSDKTGSGDEPTCP